MRGVKRYGCIVEGCNNEHMAKGYCNKHYKRYWRHGSSSHTKGAGCSSHMMSYTSEYRAWQGMKERCYNSNRLDYKNYGERGITVCNRWISSFEDFYEDMGNKPTRDHQIDRINNNGNYEPNNCHWATREENAQNTRRNVFNWFTVRSLRRLYKLNKYSHKQLSIIYNIKIDSLKNIIYSRSWREV